MNQLWKSLLFMSLVSGFGFADDAKDAGSAFKPFLSCNALADINLDVKVAHSRLRHTTLHTWYTVTVVDAGKAHTEEMFGAFPSHLTGKVTTENGKESLSVEKVKEALVGHLTFGNHKNLRLSCSPLR